MRNLLTIPTIAITLILGTNNTCAKEEAEIPTATSSDYRPTVIELSTSDDSPKTRAEPAKPIRRPKDDIRLHGKIGHFTNTLNHGVEAFFEFNKKIVFGDESESVLGTHSIGFLLDPGIKGVAQVTLNSGVRLNYADIDLSGLSLYHYNYSGEDRTYTMDFSLASAGANYKNNNVYQFWGFKGTVIQTNWHITLKNNWEIMFGATVLDVLAGMGHAGEHEANIFLGGGVFIGTGVGLENAMHLRMIWDISSEKTTVGKKWTSESEMDPHDDNPYMTELKGVLEADRLGGTPIGFFHSYTLHDIGHKNWAALGQETRSLTHNFTTGLMATY